MTRSFVVILAVLLLLSGCAQTTTVKLDPVTQQPVTTTKAGFFASENLQAHYAFETARSDNHAQVAQAKIDFIRQNGLARAGTYSSPTEQLQSNIIDSLLVGQIQTAPPPSGLQPPKTLADALDRNLTSWLGLGLQGYGLLRDRGGDVSADSSQHIINSGSGDLFFEAHDNKNPTYTLSAQEGLEAISFSDANGYTYTPDIEVTEQQGDTSNGLQLF